MMATGDSGFHEIDIEQLQTTLKAEADDKLLCHQCLERYDQPKLLPCLHTFCAGCLKHYVVNQELRCPSCKKEIILGVDGVNGLKDNFYIKIKLDEAALTETRSHKSRLHCTVCDGRDDTTKVVSFCGECSDYLCSLHYEAHQKCRATKYHAIVTIGELRALTVESIHNVPRRKPRTCSIHQDENLTIYCQTCDLVICRDCALTLHINHEYFYASNIFHTYADDITRNVETCRELEYDLKHVVQSAEFKLASLAKRFKAGNQTIDGTIDNLIAMLENRRLMLKSELSNSTNKESASLQYLKQGSKFILSRLATSIDFSRNALKFGTHAQLLDMKTLIKSRLEELQLDALAVTHGYNAQDPPMKYTVSYDDQLMELIGQISISKTSPTFSQDQDEFDGVTSFTVPSLTRVDETVSNSIESASVRSDNDLSFSSRSAGNSMYEDDDYV